MVVPLLLFPPNHANLLSLRRVAMNAYLPPPSSSRRNPIIPEDTLIYAIYPSSSFSIPFSSLQVLHSQILDVVSPHVKDYIWQHSPFNLSIFHPSSSSPSTSFHACGSVGIPHLHGRMRYGDNVEDEWFVVFLLYEVSRKFSSLSIRVWDSDGEFILIEAAFSLPRWLNPENSENRVFVRGGEVHILGKNLFPVDENVELVDAIRAFESGEKESRASDAVQLILRKRIGEYPEKARKNMHRVRVRIPLPVAQVLRHEPSLISLAVEGFYDRDVDSMKYAAKMEMFLSSKVGSCGVDMVQVCVRMSRAMYGQLVQQSFQAPRCYPMPSRDEGPVIFAEAELGMKIACGFEMMYQGRRQAGEQGKSDIWDVFKESLEKSGYFRDLLPGSEDYKRLMREAEEKYRSSALFARSSDIFNAPVKRIEEILSSQYSLADFEGIEVPRSDDESWLYNGDDELNSALLERQKEMEMYELKRKGISKDQSNGDDRYAEVLNDKNIGDMAKTLRAFVEKVSSFEGAEVPENRDLEEVDFSVEGFMKLFEVDGQQMDNDDDLEGHSSSSSSDLDMDADDYSELREYAESFGDECDSDDHFMKSYFESMNKQLKPTTLDKSFVRAQQDTTSSGEGTSDAVVDMSDDLTPVDVDFNLMKNFLDSYASQQGLSGPTSNLLGTLGLKLPDDKSKAKNTGK